MPYESYLFTGEWLRRLNEKTLELNIGAELLYNYEQEYEDCYIRAVSSNSERKVGYDFAIESPQDGIIKFYQFKAPKDKDGREYIFKINSGTHHDQHRTLMRMNGEKDLAFYAFPLIYNFNELIQYNRQLVNRTAFVPVNNINFTNHNKEHKVYIHEEFLNIGDMEYIEVNSEITKAFLFKDFTKMIKSEKFGMKIRLFINHMRKLDRSLNNNEKRRMNNWLKKGIFIVMKPLRTLIIKI